MPRVIGGLMALVALAASILGAVPPVDSLIRAAIAYVIGVFATQVWYVFFTIRTRSEAIGAEVSAESPGVAPEASSTNG